MLRAVAFTKATATCTNLSRLFLAALAAVLLSTWASQPAQADSDSSVRLAQADKLAAEADFDLPAQPLGTALKQFADQAGIQILFEAKVVDGFQAPAIKGHKSAAQVLERLLSHTDLEFTAKGQTVAVRRKSSASSASPAYHGTSPSSDANAAHLAQGDTNSASFQANGSNNPGSRQTSSSSQDDGDEVELKEVVITGSHIRNVEALTPVTTITSKALESQGYTTLSEALQQLPQNSGAGVSPGSNPVTGFGENGNYNYSFSNGINLRGLGTNDTLVLLNGRRLPPTAFGNSIDITGIPVSIIDHVDILEDGASAVYGSDAVAGVVNIVTKKDYNGIETTMRLYNIADGKAPDVGGYFLGGFNWDSGNFVFDYDYEKQNALDAAARSFSSSEAKPDYLLPSQQTSSFYAAANQRVSSELQFSADAHYSGRDYTSENNVFATNISTGQTDQFAGSVEADYFAFADWKLSLVGEVGLENDRANSIQPQNQLTNDFVLGYHVNTIEAEGEGRIASLPGGDARLALGTSERYETFRFNENECLGAACFPPTLTRNSDSIFSAFAELMVPLVGESNSLPFVRQLRIDVAGRFDRYSNFGGTTNPKVTLQWVPVTDITLHGSYAQSFKAPTLDQLAGNQAAYAYVTAANPAAPGAGNALEIDANGNPRLRPETADTYSAGATFKPTTLPGLSLEASYFNIAYKNKVLNLCNTFCFADVLNGQLGSLVQLDPTPAQLAAAYASPNLQVYCSAKNCAPATITAIANLGVNNAATVNVDGLDFDGRYAFHPGFGLVTADVAASYFLDYTRKITPAAAPSPGDGIVANPPRFRGKVNMGWAGGGWSANARMNYTGRESNQYDTVCSPSRCPVASWTTFDLSGSYSFKNISRARYLDGAQLGVSVLNLFGRDPPYVSLKTGPGNLGFDPVNGNPLGRVIAVTLKKAW